MTMKIKSVYAVLLFFTLGVTVSGSTTDSCNAADGNGAWMGDGACDPQNLSSECNWDGGDCCRCTCSNETFVCGTDGFFCVDPDVLDDELAICTETMPSLCSEEIRTNWVVENTSQVQTLAEKVNCSGGSFEVEWKGHIIVDTEIVIVDGTALNIVGTGSDAVMDGGGITRLFRVVNASLQLDNLEVRNGNASFGGAIAAMGSTLNVSRTNFTGNTANEKNGGAVFVYGGSNVSFSGASGFFNNTSNYDGGALYVVNSSVSWGGVSSFSGNSATHSGGALCAVVGSTVAWAAETVFRRNSADNYLGGALFLEGGIHALWTADAHFIENRAQIEGGAIFVNHGLNVSWSEGAVFSGNTVTFGGGGAMFIEYSSNVALNGVTTFESNNCGAEGGAVSSRALESSTSSNSGNQGSSLSINGATTFAKNKCESNGGGLAVMGGLSVIMKEGNISFVENEAVVAGGGASISSPGEGPIFTNASFISNYAEVGGGVFITGSGTSLDPDVGELSATFEECRFIGNKAEATGGAIESATGAAAITNTHFKGNEAGVGGALRLAGASSVKVCTFEDNISDLDGGQAISWIGYDLEIENCSFRNNAYNCDPGTFVNETGSGDRYEAVCSGCDECENCYVERDGRLSTCSAVMEHSTSRGGPNVTLMTLLIDPGYWRATNDSTDVRACYNEDACRGGLTGSRGFCSTGYKGPYCAVCNDSFVKGPGFTCTKCSENVWGIVAAVVCSIVAAVMAVLAVKYVTSANMGAGRGFFARLLRRVPLQSVKIIIVAWQILTQFVSVADVTYPGVYQDFLNAVDVLNFDLSWMISTGCVVVMDFHGKLLTLTLGPILAMLFLSGTYTYTKRRYRSSDRALKVVRHKHVSMALLLMFLVYSSSSSVIFQMFDCEKLDDGKDYLRADYTIECDSLRHRVLMAYAVFMLLLYPLGIPALFAYVLFRNRRVLTDEVGRENELSVRSISDLWKPYKPSRYYYEVIECGRRIVLTGVILIVDDDSAAQIAVTLILAFVFTVISEGLAPYESQTDAWVCRMGHAVVVSSMYYALLLKVDVSGETPASQKLFDTVLILTHVGMILTVVVETILTGYSMSRGQVENPWPPRFRSSRFWTTFRSVSLSSTENRNVLL